MTKPIEVSKRKFYKTRIVVDVLSEDPLEWDNLNDINYLIVQGDCSGHVEEHGCKVLNGRQAARELMKQGSDPGFFRLTEKGEDVDD